MFAMAQIQIYVYIKKKNIHCNNRLHKPWLRNIKIHGEGFGQWHICKKCFGSINCRISAAEIILQIDNQNSGRDKVTRNK